MKPILIIQAPYYKDISSLLLDGAVNSLEAAKVSFDVIDVPGALEIPAAISFFQKGKKYNGYVALGCVIRGETTHYDIVSNESARALMALSVDLCLPIGNGIITTENEAQALCRADKNALNKGGGAVNACLEMIKLRDLSLR